MKSSSILLLILFFATSSASQIIIKKEECHKFEYGFHTNGMLLDHKDPITFDKSYYIFLGTELFVGSFPVKNLGIGVIASYSFVKSNFISLPPLYSAGIYARYYIPYKINRKILKNFDFFIETNYNKTNYLYSINQPIYKTNDFDVSYPFIYNKLSQTNINIPIGFNYKIIKKLYVEISYQYVMFPKGNNKHSTRVGLNYYFLNCTKNEMK